jgi:hypothetical protein
VDPPSPIFAQLVKDRAPLLSARTCNTLDLQELANLVIYPLKPEDLDMLIENSAEITNEVAMAPRGAHCKRYDNIFQLLFNMLVTKPSKLRDHDINRPVPYLGRIP